MRDCDFLTYDELMERLPDDVSRDAIRVLIRERGLTVHRIGRYRMFYVREVIAASAVGSSDGDSDGSEA